jgi:hypothetical protein
METKKPRASKKKVAAAPASESIMSAFGTAAATTPAPALFIEEIEHVTAPTPPKKSAAKKTNKPPVIAAVTPDGIQGTLTPIAEQRPLIAHLPIRSTDIDNDMFASDTVEMGTTQVGSVNPFEEIYAAPKQVEEMPSALKPIDTSQFVLSRPSLPTNYSEKLMVRFQDANRDQCLPDSTDVACFWDCHTFRGSPCVIPTVIEEGIWRVYGNFCSPECAAAYLFNEHLDSHVKLERYALLNRLYAVDEAPVRLAAPRTVLRLFGGSLEISDYRALMGEKRLRIDVQAPPMISIIQVMDTKPIDFYDASMKNTFIPWEMDRMNRPGAQGLRLRRTKPISEKEATLEFCMGITS